MGVFSDKKLAVLQARQKTVKQHTILIVDDEENNLKTLFALLDDYYHVLTANNGQDALDLIQQQTNPQAIDVLITDQQMPQLTGVQLLERTLLIMPQTIRIVLTAFSDVEAILAAINKGQVYKFMLKPFEHQDMLLTLQRALESRALEQQNQQLVKALQETNQTLEQKIKERTQELEHQNLMLLGSNRRLEDLHITKTQLLERLAHLNATHIRELRAIMESLPHSENQACQEALRRGTRELHHIEEALRPISSLYVAEKVIQSKRVLLADTNKKQQLLAKLALGGTGVQLDLVSDLREGQALLSQHHYDILLTDSHLVELSRFAQEKYPEIRHVFITSEDAPAYLPILRDYPRISNIVSRRESDRAFTLKNIFTTVSKLISDDLFGLEKYLNWGVDVKQHAITSSTTRQALIQAMEEDFLSLGLRPNLISRCSMVAEELLMNAIYDAPCDASGKPLYNHLSRMVPVHLPANEQGIFRYACDGIFLAISAQDPFGGFDRKTILDYLESCYTGRAGTLNHEGEKGGAGRGLFQIMETAELLVINVKAKIKTEVIALFNMDPDRAKLEKTTSLHYFYT